MYKLTLSVIQGDDKVWTATIVFTIMEGKNIGERSARYSGKTRAEASKRAMDWAASWLKD